MRGDRTDGSRFRSPGPPAWRRTVDADEHDVDRLAVLRPLRRSRFRRMVTAQFVSELGDGITTVALPLYVYARTDVAAGDVADVHGRVAGRGGLRGRRWRAGRRLRPPAGARLLVPRAGRAARGRGRRRAAAGWPSRSGCWPGPAASSTTPRSTPWSPSTPTDDLQQVLALRRIVQSISYTIGPAVGAVAVTLVGPRQGPPARQRDVPRRGTAAGAGARPRPRRSHERQAARSGAGPPGPRRFDARGRQGAARPRRWCVA